MACVCAQWGGIPAYCRRVGIGNCNLNANAHSGAVTLTSILTNEVLCKEHQREAIKKQQARWMRQRKEALQEEREGEASDSYFRYEEEKAKLQHLPREEKKREIKKAREKWTAERGAVSSVLEPSEQENKPGTESECIKVVDSFCELVPHSPHPMQVDVESDDEQELAELSDFLVAVELDAAWSDDKDQLMT